MKTISLKMEEDELLRLKGLAEDADLTVSEYIRRLVRGETGDRNGQDEEIAWMKDRITKLEDAIEIQKEIIGLQKDIIELQKKASGDD